MRKWNWQQEEWPKFSFDEKRIESFEKDFIHQSGILLGALKYIDSKEKEELQIELITQEALKTSAIEGEILDRESVQFSLRKHFGLKQDSVVVRKRITGAEAGIAEMMVDLYKNFAKDLKESDLFAWNSMILEKANDSGKYRSSEDDPMQVVSGSIDKPKIHFEAPPAKKLKKEMSAFITWFNRDSLNHLSLVRAGIAHLYFVCIHPFNDGNGRIARALSEKVLSQSLKQASLIALSLVIEKHRKEYYKALDQANKDLDINAWLEYFAQLVLKALSESQKLIDFVIAKTKFFEKHKDDFNSRQHKVIVRIFKEGPDGFAGGLSAENYISISGSSRATATRDLQDLVEKKVLNKTGQLKSTRYYLNI
jgi:Fic family protein